MARTSSIVMGVVSLVALTLALSTCTGSLSNVAATDGLGVPLREREDLLRGTWAREYEQDGYRVRHVLSLHADGSFREKVRVVGQAGAVTDFRHEGTWLYDGTNLKRRYTLMNGKPPSRLKVPFATFEISFDSRNDFTGVDHIHGHRIAYHRLPVGSEAGAADAPR